MFLNTNTQKLHWRRHSNLSLLEVILDTKTEGLTLYVLFSSSVLNHIADNRSVLITRCKCTKGYWTLNNTVSVQALYSIGSVGDVN